MAPEKKKEGPKVVTVIIKVDLECRCCAKKIKSALCKLQNKFKISSIAYDWKDTVTVSGPFDPYAFKRKICCIAYKVIIDIYIKPPPDPPSKPPTPTPLPTPTAPPHEYLPWPCLAHCPLPCQLLCPPPCPPPCPTPMPFPTPMWPCCHQPCTCNKSNHDCCSCNTPRPPPISSTGYPWFKIECESEPSPICSIM